MSMFTRVGRKLGKRENRLSVIFFIITMLVATSPLISRYCINGHDLEYHLLRIESLKEGILIGRPFLKVNTLFFGGAGYASSMFYSDVFMFFPALLRVFGLSIGRSYHIFVAVIFILCYLSTYYSVYKMSLSKYAASLAAIFVTLCPYHMDDMLIRGAVGEYLAFIFIPLAVYGVYNVIFEEMDNPFVFGLGFGGLILTHPATCLLCAVFAFCALLIYIKRLIKEPSVIFKLAVVTILTLGATAFFWLPMLEQFRDARFYVSDNWSDLLDAALSFPAIFAKAFPCLGFLLIAFLLPRFTLRRKDYPILSYVDTLIVAAMLFAVGSSDIVPWERIGKYFSFLQFPWRMLIMSSTLLAVADAIILKLFAERFKEVGKEAVFDLVLLIALALFSQNALERFQTESMGYYDYGSDYYSYEPFTANVIAGEWLPMTVTSRDDLVTQSKIMAFEDGSFNDFTRERAIIESDILAGHEYVDVPFIYYKGYAAYITDLSGEVTALTVTGDGFNGMCRVMLDGRLGRLKVLYKSTRAQIISYIISGLVILLLLGVWFFEYRNKRKLKSNAQKAGAVISAASVVIALPFVLMTLTGCGMAGSAEGMKETGSRFENPDDMVEFLKDKEEENKPEEEFETTEDLITVNFCKRGYEKGEDGFALVIDETSGEQMIYLTDPKEAAQLGADGYFEADGLYESMLSEELRNPLKAGTDIKDIIIHEADMLLCAELFSDKPKADEIKKRALEYADRILENSSKDVKVLDMYNTAAVLTKAAYVLDEWDKSEEAVKLAEELFDKAESESGDEGEPVAARVFAAAELYRNTGLKTYRSVVDAALMDLVPEGFSYDEPGYYGLFTYLMSENQGNYKVSSGMMDLIFDRANTLIKEDIEKDFISIRVDDNLKLHEEEEVQNFLDNARIVALANYVSECVEYEKYVVKVLCYTCGANLSGSDYTQAGEALYGEPLYLIFDSLI